MLTVKRFRKSLFVLFLFCSASLCHHGFSQNLNLSLIKPINQKVLNDYGEGVYFENFEPFRHSVASRTRSIDRKDLSDFYYVEIKSDELGKLNKNRSASVRMTIPFGDREISMLLTRSEVLSEDFRLFTSGTGEIPQDYNPGLYYRGVVEGENNSLVAISVFEDNIIGMVSTEASGNIVISQTENRGVYLLYSDRDLKMQNPTSCAAVEPDHYAEEIAQLLNNQLQTRDEKCFKLYLECDYALYQNKGSVSAVTDWVTALYNNVAALYQNESLLTKISEIYVWTTPDPYSKTSSYTALTQFKTQRPNFNGDLAQLVALGGNNIGGIAWIGGLCTAYKYSYANIQNYYNSVPVYSWTVEVMTHEIGHNLGSPHTHSCSWPGGALDNCYPVEGNCNPGPPPTTGGTIMSYCHLTNYGINFNNGFGQKPGDLIRAKVNASSCLGYCDDGGGPMCGAPQSVTISNITNNSAMVSWTTGLNGIYYIVEYKVSTSNTWTILPQQSSTSLLLSGLNSGTTYHVRIKTICSEGESEYSAVYTFTTGNACGIPYGPFVQNITETSAYVYWKPVPGATSYDFRFKLTSSNNWATINTSSTSISLSGLTPGTSYDVGVRARCGTVYSDYTGTYTFVTLGNPPGGGSGYCDSHGTSSAFDWIQKLTFGSFTNESGNNNGYGDFLNQTISAKKNTMVIISVTPGMIGNYTEFWTVWIDFNQNESFTDPGEQVATFTTTNTNPNYTKIFIPDNASLGNTRMRIQMKRGSFSTSCEAFPYGEVEDYTLSITQQLKGGTSEYSSSNNTTLFPNPFNENFTLNFESENAEDARIEISDITSRIIFSHPMSVQKGLNSFRLEDTSSMEPGIYMVRIIGQNINETHKAIKVSNRN